MTVCGPSLRPLVGDFVDTAPDSILTAPDGKNLALADSPARVRLSEPEIYHQCQARVGLPDD